MKTEKKSIARKPIIAVIGDGGISTGDPNYNLAYDLGKALVDNGYRIISGGKGGIMEAVSKGGQASFKHTGGEVIGVLPDSDPGSGNTFLDIVIPTGLGHFRNFLVARADAVIAIGGGAGTLSELAMAWISGRMVIAFRTDGWSGKLADTRIDKKIRINWENDRVIGVESPAEVINELNSNLSRYRYR